MTNIIAAFISGIAFTIVVYWIIEVLIDVHKRKKAKDVVKKLRKYVIYCVDPFDDDRLGKLQYLSSAQEINLEDFPKPWTTNITNKPLKIEVTATSAREAISILMDKGGARYFPYFPRHICTSEMHYALWAVYYEDGTFVGYYDLFK